MSTIAPDGPSNSPPLIFVFDGTRLRSHLFFRYLSTSPRARPIYHPFLPAAMFGAERIKLSMRESQGRPDHLETKGLVSDATFEGCTREMLRAVADARQSHQIPLANEHWFNVVQLDLMLGIIRDTITRPTDLPANPTRIPDDMFDSLTPIVLIRHPIHSIDSIYRSVLLYTRQRPGDESFATICANRPLRILFDFFTTCRNVRPIVVDGDDILWRTDEVSRKLCSSLGLESLSDSWTPTSRADIDAMNPLVYELTQDIHASKGIDRPAGALPEEPKIEDAVAKWTAKYGDVVAQQLRGYVEDNMPHYEYLKQYKS